MRHHVLVTKIQVPDIPEYNHRWLIVCLRADGVLCFNCLAGMSVSKRLFRSKYAAQAAVDRAYGNRMSG